MALPSFSKSKFTVRVLDRFQSFFQSLNPRTDAGYRDKKLRLKQALHEITDQHFHANEITDAEIDSYAKEALGGAKSGDFQDFLATKGSPAPPQAPVSTAKPAPAPAAVDHSGTIASLNSRLVSMERELSALKTENASLKTAAVAPVPAPVAQKPKTPSKVELAEAALAAVKVRKAKGEATGLELATAAFNLEEAKRRAKSEANNRPVTYTAEDAAKLSHHEKELRLAHLAHAFDQCNTPQGRNALWTINKDEIRALCAGPLTGWITSFRTS